MSFFPKVKVRIQTISLDSPCITKRIAKSSKRKQKLSEKNVFPGGYGCSFVAKRVQKVEKKTFFFLKKHVFYKIFAEKMFFYGKKSFILKFFFPEKAFFTEKNINENENISIYFQP